MSNDPADDYERALDPFFTATGRVVREWAELETYLIFHMASLLQTDQFRARVVWMSMPNLRARVEMMGRLARTYVDDPVKTDFERLLRRTKKLAANRNDLAHNHGGIDLDTKKVGLIRDKEDGEVGVVFGHVDYLDFNNVRDWEKCISTLRKDFSDMLPILRKAIHGRAKMHRGLPPDQNIQSGPIQPESNCGEPQPRSLEPFELSASLFHPAGLETAYLFGPLPFVPTTLK